MESHNVRAGRTSRIVAAVVVTTVAGILLAATFFRRRRRKPQSRRKQQNGALPNRHQEATERNIPVPVRPSDRETVHTTTASVHQQQQLPNSCPSSPIPTRMERALSASSVTQVASEYIHSPVPETETDGPSNPLPTPQEMIHLGAASIDSALRYWEEALDTATDGRASGDHTQYSQLNSLLRQIKELCSEYIELSALTFDPSRAVADEDALSAASSTDSFHSLSEDEELPLMVGDAVPRSDDLYQHAMVAVKHHHVHCRTNRTAMLHCESKEDYLAKVKCVREALALLMSEETMKDWFAKMGMQLIADILATAGYATEDFYTTFEKLMDYVKKPENMASIEQELKHRKVKDLSFYDAVLDFFLLDAFDDLEEPPASVVSIVQNRWLSQSVKETGLGAAIWSVLSAKKQMLKNPRGFMGHCYDVSKHVTPALAWGFMGTDEELKALMNEFKDQVLLFTRSMFSKEKCRYSTVPELADDIFLLAKEMFENLNLRLPSCER